MDHMGHDLTSVLVSGASGYLGSRTLKLLMENGVGATGLGRLKPGLIHCDLTDPDDVGNIMEEHRPETIIHCAAEVPKSAEDYANTQAGPARWRWIRSCQIQRGTAVAGAARWRCNHLKVTGLVWIASAKWSAVQCGASDGAR